MLVLLLLRPTAGLLQLLLDLPAVERPATDHNEDTLFAFGHLGTGVWPSFSTAALWSVEVKKVLGSNPSHFRAFADRKKSSKRKRSEPNWFDRFQVILEFLERNFCFAPFVFFVLLLLHLTLRWCLINLWQLY